VITTSEADKRRALCKKQVRGVAMGVRILAGGLRKRMNEAVVKDAGKAEGRDDRPVNGTAKPIPLPTLTATAQVVSDVAEPLRMPVRVAAE
jgi:hypothetical protein